jgi:hypothetical protein
VLEEQQSFARSLAAVGGLNDLDVIAEWVCRDSHLASHDARLEACPL